MTSPYKEQLDAMVWSYSRVNSYFTCPYMFKLTYLDRVEKAGSSFGEWGSLCHSIYEDYAKGDLAIYELGDAYDDRWKTYMLTDFPPSRGGVMASNYYTRGKELFDTFEGFPEHWEILAVEQEVSLTICGRQFVGYIDLLVRDKTDGRLIVVDHKSKSKFANAEELEHYTFQLYLYALWVYEAYGEYPKQLIFNMFRTGTEKTEPFTERGLKKAVDWFTSTIDAIYADVDFWDKIELSYEASNKPLSSFKNTDFFCNYICGCRGSCLRSHIHN